ncbi:vang-like protein 2-B [Pollicipes pollicipes]|uniref:vang-like protein 2-B n=1 Tax=Pollicipes pollicipes TaxID=41117 RepID=UPI001885697E|nr:vang-like protein 2-B [Pollicipes pollicipes]XP_037082094.1 vang-like protein 2-B [Pollicipes pollicipes]
MLGILHAESGPWTRMDPAAGSLRSVASKSRSNGKLPQHSLSRQMNHSRLEESFEAPGTPVSTVVNMFSSEAAHTPAGQDVIEVQILPQDNWADNTTAVTGNTSDVSTSLDDFGRFYRDPEHTLSFQCQRYLGTTLAGVISLFAFLSPVAMVIIPKTSLLGLKQAQLQCGAECDGTLISFAFKLVILLGGTWALFLRPPRATMPRIFTFRAVVLVLVFVFTFSYWLFFFVRVLEERAEIRYYTIVVFAGSLVDALLWIHYLAVLLLELRHAQPQYAVRVVRSPDGQSRLYPLGRLSIQRAAVHILERYYTDFPVYNPYLERLPTKASRKPSVTSYKYYDVDGSTAGSALQSPSRIIPANRRKDASHNERFYEEHEYERRVKKRRSRLVTAAEEAFTHIRRLKEQQGPAIPMDSHEAAQAIFPTMARPLQKYLRVTRQQPRHTMEAILAHLAQCLAHDMSPRAFLERYLSPAPVLQSEREARAVQSWALVCDTLLSRPAAEGVLFQLRQHDVSLLCSVVKLPHFNITEEIIDPKSNKFVLRLSSETSV